MTKPVTSVAAMILVDECKLDLAAPVHQYIPEFKDMMVGVETIDPASGQSRLVLEPQKRPMTVDDLLRHTSGLVYFDQGNTAVHRLYRESGLYDKGLARDSTLKDFVSRVARLPLAHQPGEVWEYACRYQARTARCLLFNAALSQVEFPPSAQPPDAFVRPNRPRRPSALRQSL